MKQTSRFAKCKHCGEQIINRGTYWEHTGIHNPRHPAQPDEAEGEPLSFPPMSLEYLSGLIEGYTKQWQRYSPPQWDHPTLKDAVGFMTTEAAEALSVALSLDSNYVRNNPDKDGLGAELADTLMMLLISADLAKVDLQAELHYKLSKMDEKKRNAVSAIRGG